MKSIDIIISIDWNYASPRRMMPGIRRPPLRHSSVPGALDMLGIGRKFPQFSLTGVVSSDLHSAFQPFTQDSFPGKWQVVFFWPKDFTFVCPTEIAAFGKLDKEFKARDAQILGVSIDSEFVHLAWRRDKQELKDLPFPMLSDIKRELSG